MIAVSRMSSQNNPSSSSKNPNTLPQSVKPTPESFKEYVRMRNRLDEEKKQKQKDDMAPADKVTEKQQMGTKRK